MVLKSKPEQFVTVQFVTVQLYVFAFKIDQKGQGERLDLDPLEH